MQPGLLEALSLAQALYQADDYLVVINDETLIDVLTPDFAALAALAAFEGRGVLVATPSRQFEFVSSWFGNFPAKAA